MTDTGKATDFRNPDTIKFRIGGQAVIVVVCNITERTFIRIETHITFSLVQRIVRITPRCARPIARKRSTRRNVDDVKKAPRVIQSVRTRIAQVMRGRILVLRRIAFTVRLVVETVRKAIVELFKERLERAVFGRNLIFVQFKVEKVAAHAVLDIRQIPFEHARREVMVLRNLNRQALIVTEFTRVRQRSIRLLVQDCACL